MTSQDAASQLRLRGSQDLRRTSRSKSDRGRRKMCTSANAVRHDGRASSKDEGTQRMPGRHDAAHRKVARHRGHDADHRKVIDERRGHDDDLRKKVGAMKCGEGLCKRTEAVMRRKIPWNRISAVMSDRGLRKRFEDRERAREGRKVQNFELVRTRFDRKRIDVRHPQSSGRKDRWRRHPRRWVERLVASSAGNVTRNSRARGL